MPLCLFSLLLSSTVLAGPGAGSAPAYKLEIRDARRIEAVLSFEVRPRALTATEWIIVAGRAPELPGQAHVSTRLEPLGVTATELSPQHRPIVTARIPAAGTARERGLNVRVTYRATLRSRQLVPLDPGEPAPSVSRLPAEERRGALAATATIDFRSKTFQSWLDARGLRRAEGEEDVAFARRVFLAVKDGFRYQWPPDHDGKASTVCRVGRGDCACLSVLFVAALRANGVPARALVGRWAQSIKPGARPGDAPQTHVKGEFFADGIGWVPADPTAALNDRSPTGLQFFGCDRGDFLVQNIDFDLVVNTVHFGRKTVRHLQGVAHWVTGAGPWEGLDTREDWRVRTLPFDGARR
jgi:hypothetical protein